MKKSIIIIILVAIIALGGFWVWKNQGKKEMNQDDNQASQVEQNNQNKEEEKNEENNQEISDPEKVVREYFKLHLDRLNKRSSVNIVLSSKFVTKNFVNNFNKLEKPLFYDPFICAQDYPKDMNNASVVLIEKKDTWISFDVKIDKDWVGEGFKMDLVKDKNDWKIDKIICPENRGGIF